MRQLLNVYANDSDVSLRLDKIYAIAWNKLQITLYISGVAKEFTLNFDTIDQARAVRKQLEKELRECI